MIVDRLDDVAIAILQDMAHRHDSSIRYVSAYLKERKKMILGLRVGSLP